MTARRRFSFGPGADQADRPERSSPVMAGLVPAIHVFSQRIKGVDPRVKPGDDGGVLSETLYHSPMQKGGWVYIMTNRRSGTLYIGVTSDLSRRAWQHREGLIDGFTKQYGLTRLVYYEWFDDIRLAIQREKTMKHWPRAWKVRLIHGMNPSWDDLYEILNQLTAALLVPSSSCPDLLRASTPSWRCGSEDAADLIAGESPG